MSDTKTPIVVACAVIHDSQKDMFLMGQRANHKHNGGYWEFIGGKSDPEDKDIQATIEREIEEEIGAKGKAMELVTRIVHSYINGPTLELHFIKFELAKDTKINPDPDVYQNVEWIKMENLMKINLSHGDHKFAQTLVK